MKNSLREDLARQAQLAFRRVRPGADLLKRIHSLPARLRKDSDIERLRQWLMVPFSLWPIDVIGLADHVVRDAERDKLPNAQVRKIIALLDEPPNRQTCGAVSDHEHLVSGGSYESLIKAEHKFGGKEVEILEDKGFQSDWAWIKSEFDVDKFRSENGVIRRRMVFERNFRPREWDFTWKKVDDRFLNVFDAFCHKWMLYGMEWDKPLLQKLSVTITPYGTMIVIPRYWSFDCGRDLKWGSITRLHNSREVHRQGAKLIANQAERRKRAAVARKLMAEARRKGLKGETRDYWVMEQLGWSSNIDPRQLRRLLNGA